MQILSPEPFLRHFGIGGLPHGESLLGMFLKKEQISAFVDIGIDRVEDNRVVLADDRAIEFSHAMIVPSFLGDRGLR